MASTYTQGNMKKQKVRETTRISDSIDYFQGIEKVVYNNMASTSDTMVYKYYNQSERLHGRSMEDWLKYSVSFTAFKFNGSDNHGKATYQMQWDDGTLSTENNKRRVKAFFDFCLKLGTKYWTAFDTDLVPYTDNHDEWKNHLDEIVEYIQECTQRMHLKLLWIAPDLHSHVRYASGALTNNDPYVLIQSATQVKKALEIAHKLNAECFLIWPYREGYKRLYQTDISREIKLFTKLLKMFTDYKDRLPFRGQFLIWPFYMDKGSYRDGNVNRYMWDTSSCICLLKQYNLERSYKVYVEPGHQMYIAQGYNMLGGININDEKYVQDNKTLTLMMKCIIDQNMSLPGGINLHVSPERESTEPRDLFLAYIKVIDGAAKALRVAATMVSEQMFNKYVQQRYASYHSGVGLRLMNGEITLEDCEEYTKKNQAQYHEVVSSRSEHWDIVFQRYLDNCDHI